LLDRPSAEHHDEAGILEHGSTHHLGFALAEAEFGLEGG
jgi:hypothetical protein